MGYTHGTKWTDERIEQEILRVVRELKLTRFPTAAEMIYVTGNRALSVKLSKSNRQYWADRIGLGLSNAKDELCEMYIDMAIELIKEHTGLESIKTDLKCKYDLIIDKSVKVEVKFSKTHFAKDGGREFDFSAFDKFPNSDICILFCVNDDKSLNRILIIPSAVTVNNKTIALGFMESKKWDCYVDRWDIIKSHADFLRSLKDAKLQANIRDKSRARKEN